MTWQRPVASFLFFAVASVALWCTDVALCGGAEATDSQLVHPIESPAPQGENVEPDVSAEDRHPSSVQEEVQASDHFVDGEETNSMRVAERPRTTKRLYTTRGTIRADSRRKTLTKVKLLSLAALLAAATLALAFKGKLWASEEDEESEEEDMKQPENR